MKQAKQGEELEHAQVEKNGTSNWRWNSFIKKVALTGAAMASAPVLAPSLLLFSALGLALSFPFALYFAGITGTHKLMAFLFPLQSQRQKQETTFEEEDAEDDIELAAKDMKQEGNEEEREIEIVEPSKGRMAEIASEDKPAEPRGKPDDKENKGERRSGEIQEGEIKDEQVAGAGWWWRDLYFRGDGSLTSCWWYFLFPADAWSL